MAFLLPVLETVESEFTVPTTDEEDDLLEELGEPRIKTSMKRIREEGDERYTAIIESDQESANDDPDYDPTRDDFERSDAKQAKPPAAKKAKVETKSQAKTPRKPAKVKPKSKLQLIQESDAKINSSLESLTNVLTKSLADSDPQSPKPSTSKNYNFLMSLADSLDSITDQKKLNEVRSKILEKINEYIWLSDLH